MGASQQWGQELPPSQAVTVNSGFQPSGRLGDTTAEAGTGVANF